MQRFTQMQASDVDIYRQELRRAKQNMVSSPCGDKPCTPGCAHVRLWGICSGQTVTSSTALWWLQMFTGL